MTSTDSLSNLSLTLAVGLIVVVAATAVVVVRDRFPQRTAPLIGLANNGNFCFVNAAFQLLAAASTWSNAGNQGIKMFFADKFCALLHALNKGSDKDHCILEVAEVVEEFPCAMPKQQDSHEFLMFLLPLLESRTDSFTFSLQERLRCGMCKRVRTIESASTKQQMLTISPVDLECLQLLIQREFKVQMLQDVHCPTCKARTRTQKKCEIQSLGDNWVLHLARLGFGGGSLGKSMQSVNCPFELDAGKVLGKQFRLVYELMAFIVHLGSALSGHYICYRKFKGEWFAVSDEKVKKVDGLPSTSQAYILLYSKKILE